MIDGLPVSVANGVGVVAVVLLLGWMLATGRLFTRRQYDDAAHERDEWRAECRIKDQRISDLTEQNTIMLREIVPALNQHLAALRKVGTKARAEDL